jgi:hypothetical protein
MAFSLSTLEALPIGDGSEARAGNRKELGRFAEIGTVTGASEFAR